MSQQIAHPYGHQLWFSRRQIYVYGKRFMFVCFSLHWHDVRFLCIMWLSQLHLQITSRSKRRKKGLFLYYTYSANVQSTHIGMLHARLYPDKKNRTSSMERRKTHDLHGKNNSRFHLQPNNKDENNQQAGSEDFDVPSFPYNSFPYNCWYLGPLDKHSLFFLDRSRRAMLACDGPYDNSWLLVRYIGQWLFALPTGYSGWRGDGARRATLECSPQSLPCQHGIASQSDLLDPVAYQPSQSWMKQ